MQLVLTECCTDLVARGESPALGLKQLPETFIEMHPGEGSLADLGNAAEVVMYGGFLFNDKLYMGAAVVYHYRNDATRHMWGSPVTLEPNLPSEREQAIRLTAHMAKALSKMKNDDVLLDVAMHEYTQHDGTSTDDRHFLIFLFEHEAFLRCAYGVVSKILRLIGERARSGDSVKSGRYNKRSPAGKRKDVHAR